MAMNKLSSENHVHAYTCMDTHLDEDGDEQVEHHPVPHHDQRVAEQTRPGSSLQRLSTTYGVAAYSASVPRAA
eukprot:1716184-Rhodomonas_salina.1